MPARLAGFRVHDHHHDERDALLPARYHRLDDVPDRIDLGALDRAHGFALELVGRSTATSVAGARGDRSRPVSGHERQRSAASCSGSRRAESVERSDLTRYMRWLEAERGRSFDDYAALWAWSVDELEEFWASIWDFFEVRGDGAVLARCSASREMPGASWFPGAELNYAEHVFRDKPTDARRGPPRLRAPRARRAQLGRASASRSPRSPAGLRALGVERGDRVVAYMPNIPETLIAFLATASIGAIWSSCSPDFGASSVVDRFAQIEPKVLFCVDGYRYNGRDFDRLDVVAGLQR